MKKKRQCSIHQWAGDGKQMNNYNIGKTHTISRSHIHTNKIELLLVMVPIGFTNAILMCYRTYLSGFDFIGCANYK